MPSDCTPISFELFPFRGGSSSPHALAVVEALIAQKPSFVSVTFGAGGAERRDSLALLAGLLERNVDVMAHLTCVGLTVAETSTLVRQFLDAGISRFLALRGDLPNDGSEPVWGLSTSAELVQLIERVQVEKEPYSEQPLPGFPLPGFRAGRCISEPQGHVEVAVATFPNGHPGSRRPDQDIDVLRAKEAAGATLGVTQLFYRADDYLRFVDRIRAAGIDMPQLPGIFVPDSLARVNRVHQLSGELAPAQLANQLAEAFDPADALEIGADFAAALCERLINEGVPGLHLYTFNRARPVLGVLERLSSTQETLERA